MMGDEAETLGVASVTWGLGGLPLQCCLTSFSHVHAGCHVQWETWKFTLQFIGHLLSAEESAMNLWIWSLPSEHSGYSWRQAFRRCIPEPQG